MPHTYSRLINHFVFSTKNRFPFIRSEKKERLYSYIGGTIRKLDGTLIEIGGIADHVHLLVLMRPRISVSKFLQEMKPSVTNWARKNIHRKFEWQDGYGAFSVSEIDVPGVRNYIRNQEQHHKRFTFEEEFIDLCEQNGIKVDTKYLWK